MSTHLEKGLTKDSSHGNSGAFNVFIFNSFHHLLLSHRHIHKPVIYASKSSLTRVNSCNYNYFRNILKILSKINFKNYLTNLVNTTSM